MQTLPKFALSRIVVKDYVALMKPRVMSLAVFTALASMCLAPARMPPVNMALAIIAIALGAGAAGALNMWLERGSDARMKRTRNRPLPAGRMTAHDAVVFAVLCTVLSVGLMQLAANYCAAMLLLMTILFYALIYTVWLKPRTPLNIVIGGAAGALPPVVGWAAMTGHVSLEPCILFLIIFLWTPPHFWALALVKSEDYRRAGIPMLPSVAGQKATTRQMLAYTVLLLPVSLLPYGLHMAGIVYAAGAILLGALFLFHAARLWYTDNLHYAMPMFYYSLTYLFSIFTLLIIDKLI